MLGFFGGGGGGFVSFFFLPSDDWADRQDSEDVQCNI